MTTIRVSDPLELVTVLPYQLGYHPTASLVAVGLRGSRVAVVQRVDLPRLPAAAGAVADVLVGHLRAARCTKALVVVFADPAASGTDPVPGPQGPAGAPAPGAGQDAGAPLAAAIRDAGIELVEHLVVRGGRVYFPECRGRCSPDEGVPLPDERDVGPVADFVALGVNPATTRWHLADRVAASGGPAAGAVAAAAARQRRRGGEATSCPQVLTDWGRFLDTARAGPPRACPSAAASARMAASLADVGLRDLLLCWLCPGTLGIEGFDPQLVATAHVCLPGGVPAARDAAGAPARGAGERGEPAGAERSAALVDRLCWLARHAPDHLAPGVLAVLASYAWWLGDGALATTALRRALLLDPGHRLARLLDQVVALGVRPAHDGVRALDFADVPATGSV